MSDIEQLYNEVMAQGIMLFNYAAAATPATAVQNRYGSAIFVNERLVRTTAEEKYAVAHEAGHIATGSMHPVGSPWEVIAQDEYRADKYAVRRLLPLERLLEALREGDVEPWQLAERFNQTEAFIRRAVYIYRCEGKI